MTDRPPSPSARRQRRYRARRDKGVCVVPVELTESHLDALTRHGFLRPEDADDTAESGRAVSALIERWVRDVLGPDSGRGTQ